MIIHSLDRAFCDFTYAFMLHQLLESKDVQFFELYGTQKELQVHHRVTRLLFPMEYIKVLGNGYLSAPPKRSGSDDPLVGS